jgi:hypothetical protein
MDRRDLIVAFEVARGRKLTEAEKGLVHYLCDQLGVPREAGNGPHL